MCGPTIVDTNIGLEEQAASLRGMYNLQYAAVATSLTADCDVFAQNNMCFSIGGRYSKANSDSDVSSGLLTGAYKLSPNAHIGFSLDKTIQNNSGPGANISNGTPLVGLFGVWSEKTDDTGLKAHFAAAYGKNSIITSRLAVDSAEPGFGKSRLTTRAASAVFSYGARITPQVIATPYVGVRASRLSRAAYTEESSGSVFFPLTYSELNDSATTALAGLSLTGKILPNLTLVGSAGLEHDFTRKTDKIEATGVSFGTDTLGGVSLNPRENRAVASLTGIYELQNAGKIVANISYRQQAFQGTDTTTGTVKYVFGF